MRLINILCTSTFLIFTVIAAPANAKILVNEWQEFAFPVADDFNCAGEDGVVSGVLHLVVSDFRKGGVGAHLTAKGILKGNDSGIEVVWKDNILDILPIGDFGNHVVWTQTETLKLIGEGGLAFGFRFNFHLTEVGGQPIVYFERATFVCNF